MTARMFAALLRKDLRVYRAAVLGTLIFGCSMYVVRLAGSPSPVWDLLTGSPEQRFNALNWAHPILDAAIVGVGVTTLLAAAYGGTAFAAERRDRSAEFAALLPPARGWVAASKATVAVACLAAAFAVHLSLGAWAERVIEPYGSSGTVADRLVSGPKVAGVLTTAALLFGTAWCLSAVLASPAIGAVVAMAVAAVIPVALGEAGVFGRPDHSAAVWYAVAGSTAAVTFAAGWACYVVRVRP